MYSSTPNDIITIHSIHSPGEWVIVHISEVVTVEADKLWVLER